MSGGGGGGDPFHEEEEHENHERYLLTYADMITLLMALFIILFAIGQTDLEKYESFREGISEEFGAPPVLDGGGSVIDGPRSVTLVESPRSPAQAEVPPVAGSEESESAEAGGEIGPLVTIDEEGNLIEAIKQGLDSGGVRGIGVHAEDQGVVVTLPADGVLFESGSSALLPAGRRALQLVSRILEPLTNAVIVEGHTDSIPMAPPLTNWELSTNRATAVVRLMIDLGMVADRLQASGYADTRPTEPNDTEAGRTANRRVEIILIVSPTEAAPEFTDISPNLSEPATNPR